MTQSTTLIDGLYFGESPRWHSGRLWYSDFYDKAVKSVDLQGDARLELQLDEQPSGLGWLPDGRLLVVGMESLILNLDSAVELAERMVANGVIGVVKKFVVTLLVMRTFFA